MTVTDSLGATSPQSTAATVTVNPIVVIPPPPPPPSTTLNIFVFNTVASQTAGTPFTVTITAVDAYGNTVTSYTGINTLSVSTGTINPTNTGAFINGVWTGSVTVTTAGSNVTLSTTGSSKSGTSSNFTVVHASAVDHITASLSPTSIVAPGNVTGTATAYDEYGNTWDVSTSASWSIPAGGDGGSWSSNVYTSHTAGTYTVETDYSGKTATASLTVNPSTTVNSFVFNTVTSQTAGTPFTVTITAVDAYGNTVTSYTGINTLSVSTGTINPTSTGAFINGVWSGSVTVTTAGSNVMLGVNDGSGHTGTSNSFTVSHASGASSVTITPVGSSVTAGASKTYSATATDTYGNTWDVTSSTTWSISSGAGGSWSSNVYTSEKAGLWTVTGTYASTIYTTDLTVNPASLDHFVFNTVATQTAASSFSITVTAKDAYGNTVTSYTGTPSLTYSAGSISPATMTAFVSGVGSTSVKVTAGSSVTITATDGTHSGTSNSFTVNPTITASAGAGGSINPSGIVSVNYGGNQRLQYNSECWLLHS